MNTVLHIAAQDLRLRMRRKATLIMMMVLLIGTWRVLPDPGSGNTLMVINSMRVAFDAQSNAIGSLSMATLFFGLAGIFVVRGLSRMEVENGVGALLASLPVSNAALVTGRWLGALAYLLVLVGVHLGTTMAVHVLNSDAPLQPLTYLALGYGVLFPLCVWLASLAALFDALPFLHGRRGDVLAFFCWVMLAGFGTSLVAQDQGTAAHFFDASGLSTVISLVQSVVATENFHIGPMNEAELSLPFWHLPTQLWSLSWLLQRSVSALLMALPLLLAIALFHRFDPVRVRPRGARKPHLLSRLQQHLLAPVSRLLGRAMRSAAYLPRAPRMVMQELLLGFMMRPLAVPALIIVWLVQLNTAVADLTGVLAAALAMAGVLSADLHARHRQCGAASMRNAIAGVMPAAFAVSLLSTLLTFLLFTWPSLMQFADLSPQRGSMLLLGLLMLSAAATLLGALTGAGKTFTVALLLALYMALNATDVPLFDVAGVTGAADATAMTVHGLVTLILLAALWALSSAQVLARFQQRAV